MERLSRLDAMGGWIAAASIVAFAMMAAGSASAQIANTKHNLGSGGLGLVKTTSTSEICVFCHTPHGGNSATSAPLWNRGIPASSSYTLYDGTGDGTRPSTLDGVNNTGTLLSVGTISALCLSCHDGSTALDLLINAPGSGGYNATGAAQGWTFNGGTTMPAGVTRLGTDLKDDHPIGVAYCGGKKASATYNISIALTGGAAGVCKDEDFNNTATPASGFFWVDTTVGTTGTREKTDMILYVRDFGTGTSLWPSVECGSCHDPHSSNATFLRMANTGSGVCLTCHNK